MNSVILKLESLLLFETGHDHDVNVWYRVQERKQEEEKETYLFFFYFMFPWVMHSHALRSTPSLHDSRFLVNDRIAAFHLCAVTLPPGPHYCTYQHLPVATETTPERFLCCSCMWVYTPHMYVFVCSGLYFSVICDCIFATAVIWHLCANNEQSSWTACKHAHCNMIQQVELIIRGVLLLIAV